MLAREFVVENAGCGTCAERVYAALSPLGIVEGITVDEETDRATVSMRTADAVGRDEINQALAAASEGSGHQYNVRPDSWQTSA